MATLLERTLDSGNYKPNTRRTYENAVAYWDAWHRQREGAVLPLLADPPAPVTTEIMRRFIADHMPVRDGDRIRPAMAAEVDAATAPPALAATLARCPSAESTRTRVVSLRSLQKRMCPTHWDVTLNPELHALAAAYEAERAASGAPGPVPLAPAAIVKRLLAACTDDRVGVQDAALVVLAQVFKTGQLVDLRISDVTVHPQVDSGRGPAGPAVWIDIREPAGWMQKATPQAVFYDNQAAAVIRWFDLRREELRGQDGPFFCSPRSAFRGQNVAKRFAQIATQAGLGGPGGALLTARSLRWGNENALFASHPLAEMAAIMDLSVPSVLRLRSDGLKHRPLR